MVDRPIHGSLFIEASLSSKLALLRRRQPFLSLSLLSRSPPDTHGEQEQVSRGEQQRAAAGGGSGSSVETILAIAKGELRIGAAGIDRFFCSQVSMLEDLRRAAIHKPRSAGKAWDHAAQVRLALSVPRDGIYEDGSALVSGGGSRRVGELIRS